MRVYKYGMNKVQQKAKKVNITKQQELRNALKLYGVAEATAGTIWKRGATTRMHYAVIAALENVLLTPAIQFLEDPENLLPKQEG